VIGCFIHGFCRKQLAPIADQGYFNLHWWVSGIWSRESEASRSHEADHLARSVEAPRLPFSHLVKRTLRLVLVGLKPRHDLPSFELLLCKELRRHPFPGDSDPLHPQLIDRLLMAVEQVWQSNRQVLIPSVRSRQQRMSSRIVEPHQFATAQDFPVELAHWPSRNEHGTVDGEASVRPRRKPLESRFGQEVFAPSATGTTSTWPSFLSGVQPPLREPNGLEIVRYIPDCRRTRDLKGSPTSFRCNCVNPRCGLIQPQAKRATFVISGRPLRK